MRVNSSQKITVNAVYVTTNSHRPMLVQLYAATQLSELMLHMQLCAPVVKYFFLVYAPVVTITVTVLLIT